ncbi:MAG: hypothetical protein COC09_01415 [Gammaproteobacteria bacterium]|nr:MAG: hypothetical protein COC09_01415 [Gammaproteobacteria bacterium]
MKHISLFIVMIISSTPVFAIECCSVAPLSENRQFSELEVPELTKTEAKKLNKFLSRFRKRFHGERVVETCAGRRGIFTREKQIFAEGLDVNEGLNDHYRFYSKLVERKGGLVRAPIYFLGVNDELEYGEIDSSSFYAPVKILAMSKDELRYMRLFRVNRRGVGSSIFEIYYSISFKGKNVFFQTETYANGFFASEERSKLR